MSGPFRITIAACVIAAAICPVRDAHATNGECEQIRLYLGPIYQQLIQRLQWHLYHRDINLKIDAETDIQAFMKFRQQTDFYNKRIVNVIREYNDGDREAEYKCNKLVLEASCEAYQVYQNAVIDLPGMDQESVLAEGEKRCSQARNF